MFVVKLFKWRKSKTIKLSFKSSNQTRLYQFEKLRTLSTTNQDKNEKQEQYGCWFCLQTDGVPVEKDEMSDKVLKKLLQCARKLT